MSWNLIKYVFKAALRDRLVLSLLILIGLGVSLSLFLGSAAVVESGKFAVVFAAGGLRLAGVIGLVLFVVFYVRRAFDTKDVEYLLSRPVSRGCFILSHAAAFSLLAAFFAVLVSVTVFALAPRAVGMGHMLWAVSLIVEFVIMVNVALFFSMVLSSAAAGTLAVFALYVLARIMGQLLGIIDAGLDVAGFKFLTVVMQVISLIVPRLDLLGQTSWLVYGITYGTSFWFVIVQGVAYSSLVIAAAMVDLVRRQF